MESHNKHRLRNNPVEQVFHDEFKKRFEPLEDGLAHDLSLIVFKSADPTQSRPVQYLTKHEEDICLTIIQWLGSPAGQFFLNSCGFFNQNQQQ